MGALVPFENTRVGKKLQQMLPPEQAATELYQLAPETAGDALDRHTLVLPPIVAGVFVGLGGLIGSTVILYSLPGNPLHVGTNHVNVLVPIIALVSGFAPAGVGSGIGYALKNKVRRPNAMLADRLKTRLVGWAHGRYGVMLDEDCLTDNLLKFFLHHQEPGAFRWLTAHGKHFKLVASHRGYYLEEYRESEGEHTPLGSVASIEYVEGTDISAFSGEANTLAQQIQQQLDFLTARSLSTEGQYILGRVGQDFKQAISLNAELLAFGEMSAGESALMAETLGTLSAELGALVAQERAGAVQQLLVQRDYVRDRQQAQVSGRLALPAATQLPAEALLLSAEDSTTTEATVISAGLNR